MINNFNTTTFNNSTVNFSSNNTESLIAETDKDINDIVYHICLDKLFCNIDSDIFKKLNIATKKIICESRDKYLVAMSDLKDIKYLHISSHANLDSIVVGREELTIDDLLKSFEGKQLDILFLSNCESFHIANALKGMSKIIISTLNSIENKDIIIINELFWNGIIIEKLNIETIELIIKITQKEIYNNILIIK